MKIRQESSKTKRTRHGLAGKIFSGGTFLIGASVIGAALVWMLLGEASSQILAPAPPKPASKTEYWAKAIRMTELKPTLENGRVSIPLDTVKEKKLVYFEYQGSGVKLPLLSYVTEGGKIVTAVGVCEPCRSTKFHIKEKSIVCNSCYTEWTLETLKGIKGGCLKYPPDVIAHTVEKGQIVIDEKVLTQWKPRI